MKFSKIFVIAMASLALTGSRAEADLVVNTFTAVDADAAQTTDNTWGYYFQVSTTVSATGLAVFDLGVLGLPYDIPVLLVDVTNAVQLGSTIVMNAGDTDPIHDHTAGDYTGTGAVPLHGYRYQYFNPGDPNAGAVTLNTGDLYLVYANYGGGQSNGVTEFDYIDDLSAMNFNDDIIVRLNDNSADFPDPAAAGDLGGPDWFGLTYSDAMGNPSNTAPTTQANQNLIGPSIIFGDVSEIVDPVVPEPSSFVLLGTAILGSLLYRRRRKLS